MTDQKPIPEDIQKLSFEESLTALEQIVRQLETGQIKLEDSVNAYEKGIHLKKHCEEKLKNAKLRVDQISLSKERKVETKPFNTES